ncbi:MAG TPA: hypothetical protein EYP65_07060 [Armatimonadetes bacterium]|nr:hypothetical protein [Armatimonadota bacterium]
MEREFGHRVIKDPLEFKRMAVQIRREIAKRELDTRYLEIEVYHGVCYLRGRLGPMGKRPDWDLKKEIASIIDMIRFKFGISNVVADVRALE